VRTNSLVPGHLRLGAVGTVARDDGNVRITGYNPNNMPLLPQFLAGALEGFNGRKPTVLVCQEIASQAVPRLDQPAVWRVVDFGVLIAMPAPGENGRC
jgi:hypothetical protein